LDIRRAFPPAVEIVARKSFLSNLRFSFIATLIAGGLLLAGLAIFV